MTLFFILLTIYVIGFLHMFLMCLFEDDHKFGCGPNWNKALFGLIAGAVWPWMHWIRWKER